MRTLRLAWRYLWARPLGAVLNLLLLGLGLGSITFLLLAAHQLERAFERDLAGIDLVVGAKGSPLQLILSGVLHIDVPTGNVPLAAVRALQDQPLVAQVIPMSLGDSVGGFRIVGTTVDYVAHYQAVLAQGRLWSAPLQVVLGADAAQRLGLQLGAQFAGSHGLADGAGRGGTTHGELRYTVVGILAPSGTVLDRLVLTDLASVWAVHKAAHHEGMEDPDDAHREVTLALLRLRTPLAAVSLPRTINSTTVMQAASPAVEITRLLHLLGVGTDVLHAFAAVLLLTAALSVFVALWSAVRERRGDLALLRMLGAPPQRIATLLLAEALWLGLLGAALGLVLGQGFAQALAHFLQLDHNLRLGALTWPVALAWVPVLALGVSLGAALLPALGAYRLQVLALLQER